MKYFDSHCHIQLPQFDTDRADVIVRMQDAQVGGVVVGTDFATSCSAIEIAEQYNFLWASVGLHPNDNIKEHFDVVAFERLALYEKVVAIGECGLDYFRGADTDDEKATQKQRFVLQIELSLKVGKPLIIHCRNAHEDTISILESFKREFGDKLQVVAHFFTTTAELTERYIALDCYLSFPGPITFTNMYDDSIRLAPLDHILSETDSPFAAPTPFRGKRNEPIHVPEVVKKIATIKGLPTEKIATRVLDNSRRVFHIKSL